MDTLRLLKMPPDKALLIMANDTHGLALSPSNSRVTGVVQESGDVAVATIEAHYDGSDGFNDPSIADPYTGVLRHRFKRLDLTELFGSSVRVALRTPTNTASVLDSISKASGIVFDENDFDISIIDQAVFEMVPKESSRRWVGTLTIELSE